MGKRTSLIKKGQVWQKVQVGQIKYKSDIKKEQV